MPGDTPMLFKDGSQYPSQGERVIVRRLGSTEGFLIHPRPMSCRKLGAVGTATSYVPGHGGDVWFVQHDDGTVGAYCYDELAPLTLDAALAALDVEPTHHTDRMVTTYDILGLDAVRAAHRAEVERAVAEERDACLKSCRDVIGAINHDGECPMLIVHAYEVHGAEKCIAAICARGAKS